jgi:hypothetical protein
LKIGKRTTTVFPAHPVLHEVHYKDWPWVMIKTRNSLNLAKRNLVGRENSTSSKLQELSKGRHFRLAFRVLRSVSFWALPFLRPLVGWEVPTAEVNNLLVSKGTTTSNLCDCWRFHSYLDGASISYRMNAY